MKYPHDAYEVIIVDGHSTDQTIEIAQKYGCRVIYEDVGTIGGARNIGVDAALGEYIVFTDADCTVDAVWLPQLIQILETTPLHVASVGGPNLTPDDDDMFGLWHDRYLPQLQLIQSTSQKIFSSIPI